MSYSIKNPVKKYIFTFLLFIFSLVISGCSDSGTPIANDNQEGSQVVELSTNTAVSDNQGNDVVIDNTSDSVDLDNQTSDTPVEDPNDSSNDSVDELMTGTNPEPIKIPQPVQASLELLPVKAFRFTWETTPNATHYRVLENPDGVSGFNDVSGRLSASTSSFDLRAALYARVNAQYLVQSCNDQGCADSTVIPIMGTLESSIGYFKASNTDRADQFGDAVSLSADGDTLAVGAIGEGGASSGINADQSTSHESEASGAVYIFVRIDGRWQQQAYIKTSNPDGTDHFGEVVSLSGDGNTLAVGAPREESAATGINGDQSDNSSAGAGAAYVFVRSSGLWQQQAYVKASNTGSQHAFGGTVSLSADGNTLAVGAALENGASSGINGDQSFGSLGIQSGAAYVFVRSEGLWQQQAYIKASGARQFRFFGWAVSLSGDGNTLAVGEIGDDSNATGINGDQNNVLAVDSGAVYMFVRVEGVWQEQAYVKASNTGAGDKFGWAVSLSADGSTLAVGASNEGSATTGINGDQSDNSIIGPGAAYVFIRTEDLWQQQAYVKASNTRDQNVSFGGQLSISADGNVLAVGSRNETSAATGLNGDQSDNSADRSGAVYVYIRNQGLWQQHAYMKASNTTRGDRFGADISVSGDGRTIAVGAPDEDSAATGLNGDQSDGSAFSSGAVYLY